MNAKNRKHYLPFVLIVAMLWLFSGCAASSGGQGQDELSKAKKLMAQGNYAEAFLQLNQALVEAPQDPVIHLNLGWLYLYTGDPAHATQELKKTEQLAPDLAETYHLRGSLLSYQAQQLPDNDARRAAHFQEVAIHNFNEALQRDSKNYQTYFDAAASFSLLNQNEQALKMLDQGFEYIPSHDLETQVNFEIASCSAQASLQRYEEAIADCEQAYKFTTNPTSKERIEGMIQNMKLMKPSLSTTLTPEESPPEGSQAAKEAEEHAVIQDAASD